MGEVSLDMIWKRPADVQAGQQATDGKIGTLAESMVSMRKRIDDIAQEIGEMRGDVRSLRADVRTVAIAVDQHSQRLEEIEKRLGIGTTAN
jgi:chromosome segregation ATPase